MTLTDNGSGTVTIAAASGGDANGYRTAVLVYQGCSNWIKRKLWPDLSLDPTAQRYFFNMGKSGIGNGCGLKWRLVHDSTGKRKHKL